MDIKEWMPEFPVASEEDKNLLEYFVKTDTITLLDNGEKWLVLGRKGTGKTAIFKYFSSNMFLSDQKISQPINFRDYPWPIHKLYKESMEGEITAYFKSWKYIIIVQAIIRLIQENEKEGTLSKHLQNAKKIITKIYGSPIPGVLDVIKSKFKRITKLAGPSASIDELSLSTIDVSFDEISQDQTLIDSLKSNAFNLLEYFDTIFKKESNKRVFILMDQLDENWLIDEISEYSKILINLLNVARNLNSDGEYNDKLKIILFLRTDIYETLRFNDKNKIKKGNSVEIRWDDKSLDEMFYERIKNFAPADILNTEQKDSDAIFEIKHVRHGATPFRHILRRSFYRPRDVIVYFNEIRNQHISSKSGLYTSKDLYNAEKEYSISLYDEFIDEWGNQKPDLEKSLNILQNIGVQTFSYSDFSAAYKKIFNNLDKSMINELLLFLFNNSIIGQKISTNWEYTCVNPYMTIDFNKNFHVNTGLKSRLMLTESRNKSEI
jgi:hypothetical protein